MVATIVGLILMIPAAVAAGCAAIVIRYWLELRRDRHGHPVLRRDAVGECCSQPSAPGS